MLSLWSHRRKCALRDRGTGALCKALTRVLDGLCDERDGEFLKWGCMMPLIDSGYTLRSDTPIRDVGAAIVSHLLWTRADIEKRCEHIELRRCALGSSYAVALPAIDRLLMLTHSGCFWLASERLSESPAFASQFPQVVCVYNKRVCI